MSGTFNLTVTKQITAEMVIGRTQAYRLVLGVSAVSGFADSGVFLMLKRSVTDSEFQGIATPADLKDLLVDTPNQEGFFRTASLDLTFPSQDEATGVLTQIETALKLLCDESFKLLTDLTVAVVETIESDG
jgi:hypothetical protein